MFPSPCVCRKELSNRRCLAVSVSTTEPHLQTSVRQLRLESSIRHTQGWLKLSISHRDNATSRLYIYPCLHTSHMIMARLHVILQLTKMAAVRLTVSRRKLAYGKKIHSNMFHLVKFLC